MPQAQTHIRSEEVQDILTKVPHWMILWGNTLILVLLMLFFTFTWFVQYPDIIATEALITSQTPPQKEYANATGKIDTLLVKDNERVRQNDVLGMIENPARLTDVLRLKAILDTLQVERGAFNFPIKELPSLSLGEIASSYAIFEKDYTDYALNKTLDPHANQMVAQSLSRGELQLRLQNLQTQKKLDEQRFILSTNEYKRKEQLYQRGVISLNEFEMEKQAFLEEEKRIQNFEITVSQLQQAINEANMNSKETQINDKMQDSRLFKNVVLSFNQLQNAIAQWELKYILKSNLDGVVSFINVWSENQNVTQGDLLFTIVPDDNQNFMANIKAPIQNSGKIKQGQTVQIQLYNYPEAEYGKLEGKVASMSAIPNEEGFYMVRVDLAPTLVTSYDIEIPFINEMTGTAEIITQDLRLLERFFYQLRGLF